MDEPVKLSTKESAFYNCAVNKIGFNKGKFIKDGSKTVDTRGVTRNFSRGGGLKFFLYGMGKSRGGFGFFSQKTLAN